jgi:uncharacterized protein (DUF983 family)
MRLAAILWRSLLWRCPACGKGRVYVGWIRMAERCGVCNLKIDRGPGFYLGSIYVNYGATTFLLVVAYFALFIVEELAPEALPTILRPSSWQLRWMMVAFAIIFPLVFFRHARCLWLALDEYFDPTEKSKPDPKRTDEEPRRN